MEDRVSSEGSHTHGDPAGGFQVRARIQHHGILGKRSFSSDPSEPAKNGGMHPLFSTATFSSSSSSSSSAKWAKRFFVVKDSFLLYYAEGEKKSFEKRGGAGGWFNMRPKGVVPLGGSSVRTSSEPGQDYVIHILSDEFQHGHLMLAAETRSEMERWVQALGEASRITWNNCQLAETMLRDLETQGYTLNKERHIYYERLQQETAALQREIDKNQELEEVNERLDAEKIKLEQSFAELREQLAQVQRDYDDISMAISIVEEDRQSLLKTASMLQSSLQDLEKEKREILQCLGDAGIAIGRNDKSGGDTYVRELQACLDLIEEERQVILREQDDIQSRFKTSEVRKQRLEDERAFISDQSDQLMSYSTLMRQKSKTGEKVAADVICNGGTTPGKPAQVASRRDFDNAALSLDCLESILLRTSNLSDQFKSEIAPKLAQLKDYFRSSLDPDKTPVAEPKTPVLDITNEAVVLRTPAEKLNYARRCQTFSRVASSEPRQSLTALVSRNSLRRDPKLPGKYHTMKLSMRHKQKAGYSGKSPIQRSDSFDGERRGSTVAELKGAHEGESQC